MSLLWGLPQDWDKDEDDVDDDDESEEDIGKRPNPNSKVVILTLLHNCNVELCFTIRVPVSFLCDSWRTPFES